MLIHILTNFIQLFSFRIIKLNGDDEYNPFAFTRHNNRFQQIIIQRWCLRNIAYSIIIRYLKKEGSLRTRFARFFSKSIALCSAVSKDRVWKRTCQRSTLNVLTCLISSFFYTFVVTQYIFQCQLEYMDNKNALCYSGRRQVMKDVSFLIFY